MLAINSKVFLFYIQKVNMEHDNSSVTAQPSNEPPKIDYKNTVFLPKTSFAMQGNLPQNEPKILEFWQNIDIYKRLRQKSKGLPKFILHFGPPYANGNIHIGHALSEVLKDITTKSVQISGKYDAPLVPGWDCHGLPIEWKVEENYRAKGIKKEDVPVMDFIKECRNFAAKWVEVQGKELERLGIVANWKDPYTTMAPKSEGIIAGKLLELMMKGLLYKGLRPVMWSVVEKTALAETEVEYQDHVSDAIYVKFDIVESKITDLKGAALVIWTTTPWTIPGNRAIAYGDEFEYELVEVKSSNDLVKADQRLVLAKELVASFFEKIGTSDYEVIKTFKGSELQGTICAHPFRGLGYDFDVPALPGEHVTTDAACHGGDRW